MGCVASTIDNDERVQICKQRKRLMKQLIVFRREFSGSQLDYLKALKNTGVTLRQFTESDSLELGNVSDGPALPVSPPLSLPPSPPPPPPFSPDLRRCGQNPKVQGCQVESMTISVDDCCTPPPPFTPSALWEFWDPFDTSFPPYQEQSEMAEVPEEENWAEAKSEFEEEDQESEVVDFGRTNESAQRHQQKQVELNDDTFSTVSSHATDMTMVVRRMKKSLDGIVKELDEYFLKASASGKEVALLMDVSKLDSSRPPNFNDNKTRSNSARVISALSWSWSSKSLQLANQDNISTSSEPCKLGAHCLTLDKLYAAERKLYKELKLEEIRKVEYAKKVKLLIKLVEEEHDWIKTEKIRSIVEDLEIEIRRLQYAISKTSSSIVELINLELFPQLQALISGLQNMWRTMYKCHKIQNQICQQLNHLTDYESTDFTTESRRQAASQLENEVISLYISFCKVKKTQQEYVNALRRWIHLTN